MAPYRRHTLPRPASAAHRWASGGFRDDPVRPPTLRIHLKTAFSVNEKIVLRRLIFLIHGEKNAEYLQGFVFLLLACAGVAHGADTGWLTSRKTTMPGSASRRKKETIGSTDCSLLSWPPAGKPMALAGRRRRRPANHLEQRGTGAVDWPAPSRFKISGLTTQGYHDRVAIPMTIAAAPRRRAGSRLRYRPAATSAC